MKKNLEAINQNPKFLPEQVSTQIKELIKNNQWEAGQKLPNEFEMAEQLSVGRGTIREAVKLLVAQNVVEIRRGCGTFVCEKPGLVDDPLGLSFMADKRQLALDMCETRLMIEPQIAVLAAARAGDEDIKKLKVLSRQVEELIYQEKDYTDADIAFHEALAACTGNQVVKQLVPIIQSGIMLFINITKAALKHNTIEDHRQIIEAVAAHDPQRAEATMIRHIQQTQANIQWLIEEEKRGKEK